MTFGTGTEKKLCFGYPMVENFEDMITRFDKIHEHDRQTQTDRRTPHYGMYVATLA